MRPLRGVALATALLPLAALLVAVATAVASFAFPPAASAAEPVAVIAAVKGKVEVSPTRGGPSQKAVFGRPLERGDRVSIGPGGAATVFFNDGNVVELAERSTMTVGGRVGSGPGIKGAVAGGAGLPGEVYANVSRFVTGGSRQSGLVAMAQLRGGPAGEEGPLLLQPRRTFVLTDRPEFRWRAVESATRYRVTLSSGEKGELWSREGAATTLPFPPDVPGLETEGEYLWEVEAFSDLKSLRRESTVFQVVPSGQTAVVRANLDRIRASAGGLQSPAARFLTGSYLAGLGLYQDAVEHFVALSQLSPSSPAPHEALGSVYTRVGLMDLAAAEFQQALALTREP